MKDINTQLMQRMVKLLHSMIQMINKNPETQILINTKQLKIKFKNMKMNKITVWSIKKIL